MRKAKKTGAKQAGARLGQNSPLPQQFGARLPKSVKHWPYRSKDVFYTVVKQLNQFDRENSPNGKLGPLNGWIAEEVARLENGEVRDGEEK